MTCYYSKSTFYITYVVVSVVLSSNTIDASFFNNYAIPTFKFTGKSCNDRGQVNSCRHFHGTCCSKQLGKAAILVRSLGVTSTLSSPASGDSIFNNNNNNNNVSSGNSNSNGMITESSSSSSFTVQFVDPNMQQRNHPQQLSIDDHESSKKVLDENVQKNKKQQQQQSPKKTLYEVLDAKPSDTREELKRKYVALAKRSHPDALIGNNESTDAVILDFTEIAAAWRILGDSKQRMRYDRTLQAEKLSENIANWAENIFTKTAAPAAETSFQILEKIAMPFFRRKTATTTAATATTATTAIATVQAGAEHGVESAGHAANEASNAVDQQELEEKRLALEQRAIDEYKRALALQNELRELAQERLKLTLRTSYSGITSSEALLVLQQMVNNRTDRNNKYQSHGPVEEQHHHHYHSLPSAPSFWRSLLTNNIAHVEDEIRTLQMLEENFVETQQIDSATQELYRDQVRQRLVAKTMLQKAIEEEEIARIVYIEAQQRVLQQRQFLDSVISDLSYAEHQAQKSSYEMERRHYTVEQQSEQVRLALLRYYTSVSNNHNNNYNNNNYNNNNYNNNNYNNNNYNNNKAQLHEELNFVNESRDSIDDRAKHEELVRLRQREYELANKSARLEVKAARLLSRANKLKQTVAEQSQETPFGQYHS